MKRVFREAETSASQGQRPKVVLIVNKEKLDQTTEPWPQTTYLRSEAEQTIRKENFGTAGSKKEICRRLNTGGVRWWWGADRSGAERPADAKP